MSRSTARLPIVRRLLLPLVGLLAAASLVTAAPGSAAGGNFPSAAVPVASGQTLTGGATKTDYSSCNRTYQCAGHAGVDYYRLPLNFGDIVTLDYRAVAGSYTNVCLLAPDVTDYTLPNSYCLDGGFGTTSNKFGEVQFTAPSTGGFLLAVTDAYGSEAWAYSVIVNVQQHIVPTITLNAPSKGKVGKKIKITGKLTPAAPGAKVSMMSKSPAHGFQDAGTATVGGDGSFHFKYLLGHRGPHQFKVFFSGGGAFDQAQSGILRVKAK